MAEGSPPTVLNNDTTSPERRSNNTPIPTIKAKIPLYRHIIACACSDDPGLLAQFPNDLISDAVCSSGCTVLHWAAGSNCLRTLDFLLGHKGSFHEKVDFPVRSRAKASGRTPLHYASRNGCLEAVTFLIRKYGASPDLPAKHGVTPFQLAVWQNHLPVVRFLVEECDVNPSQVNDFGCGAVHWIGIAPVERANFHGDQVPNDNHKILRTKKQNESNDILCPSLTGGSVDIRVASEFSLSGNDLLPLASYLSLLPGVSFNSLQRQGHTALHKAAWGGHLALVRYLHSVHGMYDDVQDEAGNYASDLSDMANSSRHDIVSKYLRENCSEERRHSCQVLGVKEDATIDEIQKAYRRLARELHPDTSQRRKVFSGVDRPSDEKRDVVGNPNYSIEHESDNDLGELRAANFDFDQLHKAYKHLTVYKGIGHQCNPSHSLNLMLQVNSLSDNCPDNSVQESNEYHSLQGKQAEMYSLSEDLGSKNYYNEELSLFQARITAVLLEFGDRGLALCNLKKKWRQVWPDAPFPEQGFVHISNAHTHQKNPLPNFRLAETSLVANNDLREERQHLGKKANKRKKLRLVDFVRQHASDVVDISTLDNGTIILKPKKITRADLPAN